MSTKFTKTFSKEYDVDGDKVTVTFCRMKRKHAMLASPIMEASNKETTASESIEHMGIAAEILKDCIINVSGLKMQTENGLIELKASDEAFIEDVLEGVYFLTFMQEMVSDLMTESFASAEQIKKPEAVQQDSSTG